MGYDQFYIKTQVWHIYVRTSFLFGSLGVHSIMPIAQCSEQAKGNIWKNYRQHKHIETIDDFDEVDFFMIFVLQKGFANPITLHQIRGKGIGICLFSSRDVHFTLHLPYKKKLHISRLGICQKIYTTQFLGEKILHTQNA